MTNEERWRGEALQLIKSCWLEDATGSKQNTFISGYLTGKRKGQEEIDKWQSRWIQLGATLANDHRQGHVNKSSRALLLMHELEAK